MNLRGGDPVRNNRMITYLFPLSNKYKKSFGQQIEMHKVITGLGFGTLYS